MVAATLFTVIDFASGTGGAFFGEGEGAALAFGARLDFGVAETAFLAAGAAVLFLTAGALVDVRAVVSGFKGEATETALLGFAGADAPVLTKDLAVFLTGNATLGVTDFLAGATLVVTLVAISFVVTFLFKVFTSCLLAVLKGRFKPFAAVQQTIGNPVHLHFKPLL